MKLEFFHFAFFEFQLNSNFQLFFSIRSLSDLKLRGTLSKKLPCPIRNLSNKLDRLKLKNRTYETYDMNLFPDRTMSYIWIWFCYIICFAILSWLEFYFRPVCHSTKDTFKWKIYRILYRLILYNTCIVKLVRLQWNIVYAAYDMHQCMLNILHFRLCRWLYFVRST